MLSDWLWQDDISPVKLFELSGEWHMKSSHYNMIAISNLDYNYLWWNSLWWDLILFLWCFGCLFWNSGWKLWWNLGPSPNSRADIRLVWCNIPRHSIMLTNLLKRGERVWFYLWSWQPLQRVVPRCTMFLIRAAHIEISCFDKGSVLAQAYAARQRNSTSFYDG